MKKGKTLKKVMSEKKYKELIQKLKNHKKISVNDRIKLKEMLLYKYCRCIKKLKKKRQNPYGICATSIYTKRKRKVPKNAPRLCNK